MGALVRDARRHGGPRVAYGRAALDERRRGQRAVRVATNAGPDGCRRGAPSINFAAAGFDISAARATTASASLVPC